MNMLVWFGHIQGGFSHLTLKDEKNLKGEKKHCWTESLNLGYPRNRPWDRGLVVRGLGGRGKKHSGTQERGSNRVCSSASSFCGQLGAELSAEAKSLCKTHFRITPATRVCVPFPITHWFRNAPAAPLQGRYRNIYQGEGVLKDRNVGADNCLFAGCTKQ